MLNRLRPGIELDYWVHVGWRAWSNFLESGEFEFGSETDQVGTLLRAKTLNLEPWGVANSLPRNVPYIEKAGLQERELEFKYGVIEEEPNMPMTNFGGSAAYDAGAHPGARGVMGNAETHCVQLPNTFAFARGAMGMPLVDSDYVNFAERLIEHRGRLIVDSWKALSGKDRAVMRKRAAELRSASGETLTVGDLSGLLFGSAKRFLLDLAYQLDLQAAFQEFAETSTNNTNVEPSLRAFVQAVDAWEARHGYQNLWMWPGLSESLHRLHSATIDRTLDLADLDRNTEICRAKHAGKYANSQAHGGCIDGRKLLEKFETFTPQLIAAMKETLATMNEKGSDSRQVKINYHGVSDAHVNSFEQ